jgi:nitroreductase
MLIDTLRNRRSIRRFKEEPVSKEHKNLLIEAMLRSPSSKGINPWEFIVIEEKETIKKLANSKTHGAAFLKNAPLAIVVCADTSKTDVWVEDASIASVILHLTAADMGLGSCWVQIRLREHETGISSQQYLTNVLNLPENIAVEAIIGIGYPIEEKQGHSESTLLHDQVSYESFGNIK